jgi:hypothetical protein
LDSAIRADLASNLSEVYNLGVPEMSSRKAKWPRVHLAHVMAIIVLVAIGLRVPTWWRNWWGDTVVRAPEWWDTFWREKPARDAWDSPITIRVGSQDDLGAVVSRFKAATTRPRLTRGLSVYVDPGGLREAGVSLETPIGLNHYSNSMSARDLLGMLLKSLGLECKLHDGVMMVTSAKSIDELIDYGDHGEVFCNHGERVPIPMTTSGLGPPSRDLARSL